MCPRWLFNMESWLAINARAYSLIISWSCTPRAKYIERKSYSHIKAITSIYVKSDSLWQCVQQSKHPWHVRMWHDIYLKVDSGLAIPQIIYRTNMVSYYKSLRLCLSATFTSTPLEKPLNGTLSFCYETTWFNVWSRLIEARESDPSYYILVLESFLPQGSLFSSSLKEVKLV